MVRKKRNEKQQAISSPDGRIRFPLRISRGIPLDPLAEFAYILESNNEAPATTGLRDQADGMSRMVAMK